MTKIPIMFVKKELLWIVDILNADKQSKQMWRQMEEKSGENDMKIDDANSWGQEGEDSSYDKPGERSLDWSLQIFETTILEEGSTAVKSNVMFSQKKIY